MKARASIAAIFGRSAASGADQAGAAAPASSSRAKGSGAPFSGRRARLAFLVLAALGLTLVLGLTFASATSPVVTVEATEVGFSSARAKGEVNPGEKETQYHFEYVDQAKFEATGWAEAAQTGSGSLPAGINSLEAVGPADLTGLNAATEYHLRLVAENEDGTEEATTTFTTQTATAPGLSVNPATGIGFSKAHISGEVEPNGGNVNPVDGAVPIHWELQYTKASEPGAWQNGGSGTIGGSEAESTGAVEVGADLSHLRAGTEYLFRLQASYAGEEGTSSTENFTTTSSSGPTATTEPVQELAPTHVSLQGVVNPNGEEPVYWFEYGLTASYEASVPASQDAVPLLDPYKPSIVSEGEKNAIAIQAVYGLTPGTTYHYRLVAKNASGESFGADETFTTLPEGESPACPNEAARSEQHARLLPDCRAYEMVSPVDKNGDYVVPRTDRVQVAAECTTSCAATFSSQGSFADSQGTGGTLSDYMALRQPSVGGSGWVTHGITPHQEPTPFPALLQGAAPTYEGDFSSDLKTGIYRAFTPLTEDRYTELTANMYTRSGLRGPGPVSNRLETACPFCEAEETNPLAPWNFQNSSLPHLDGHSSDFEHILFEDNQNLTGQGEGVNLYQSDAGQVRFVGMVPPGSETSCGGGGPACELPSPPHARAGSGRPLHVLSNDGSRVNFSAPVEPNGEFTAATQLYQRDSQSTASPGDDTTVLISASERQSPEPAQRVLYQTASADGHRVFFSTRTPLTDDTPAGEALHLYMWHDEYLNNEVQKLTVSATAGEFRLLLGGQETGDLPFDASDEEVAQAIESLPAVASAGGKIGVAGGPGDEGGSSPYTITFEGGLAETDEPTMTTVAGTTPLTGGVATATVAPWVKGGGHLTLIDVDRDPDVEEFEGGLQGVIGASADGKYLYFQEAKQLVPGKPAVARHAGLFLWHEGEIRFIGTLGPGGSFGVGANAINSLEGPSGRYEPLNGRVSADGKTLLFLAIEGAGLTGYDHGSCAGNPCSEYYVYHLESNSLACVSCSPQGEPAEASPFLRKDFGAGVAGSNHEPRAVTDDGHYVFFSTAQPLVSEDTNGVSDAYEFDSSTGEIHLLSSGTSPKASYFAEASPDGHDAFIFTAQKLVGWDVDTSYDLYDVRIDGGFPEPPPGTAPCNGESCRPAAGSAPPTGSAGSSAFVGPGNSKPPRRCGRHKVRRHGHCVVKRKHRHKHHHRAHKGGGSK